MPKKIDNCPFCDDVGTKHHIHRTEGNHGFGFYILCTNRDCKVMVETYLHNKEEDAIEAWNKRKG